MSDINFLKDYFNDLKKLLDNDDYFNDLIKVKNILKETNLKGKKTIIMITHRLSTLENCDQIYKIDKGGLKIQTI